MHVLHFDGCHGGQFTSNPLLNTLTSHVGFRLSWQHVHLHLSEVFIVSEKRQIAGIEINWWGLRVITECDTFLVLVLSEEGRVLIRHLREGAKKISLGVPSLAPRWFTPCDFRLRLTSSLKQALPWRQDARTPKFILSSIWWFIL